MKELRAYYEQSLRLSIHPDFESEIRKVEEHMTKTLNSHTADLQIIVWSFKTLQFETYMPLEDATKWVPRIKQIGRRAIKNMHEAGVDPMVYRPMTLQSYVDKFAE
jgi:hypothetical protein